MDAVLSAFVDDARTLMGADIAAISLVDEAGCDIAMRAVSGNRSDAYRHVRLRLGEGIAGQVVQSGRPVVLNAFPEDAQITPENYPIFAAEGIRAAVGVPIKVGGRAAGALAVGSRSDTAYAERELFLLSCVAAQAALAIETARRCKPDAPATVSLLAMHHLVSGQFQQIRRLMVAHARLTAMVLEGQSVKAIAETLAVALDCSVAVVDRFCKVVTSCTGEGVLDDFWRRLVGSRSLLSVDGTMPPAMQAHLEAAERGRRPIFLSSEELVGIEAPKVLTPIIVGKECLGFVLVGQGLRPLEDVDLMAVEYAATVLALKLTGERIAVEVEARLKGEFLDELLSGAWRDEETTRQRASYLGHDLTQPHGLLVIQIDDLVLNPKDFRWQQRKAASLQRIVEETVRASVGRRWPQSIVSSKGDAVVVIVAIRPEDGVGGKATSAEELAFVLHRRLQGVLKEVTVSVSLGRICHALEHYPKAYREASFGLEMAHSFALRDQVILLHQLGSYRLLLNVEDREDLLEFVRATLGPIQHYDAAHGTQLLKTLDTFLRHDCNVRSAAGALFVHPNTLHYRLRRLEAICSVSLSAPSQLLDLQLALKILHVAGFHWHPVPRPARVAAK